MSNQERKEEMKDKLSSSTEKLHTCAVHGKNYSEKYCRSHGKSVKNMKQANEDTTQRNHTYNNKKDQAKECIAFIITEHSTKHKCDENEKENDGRMSECASERESDRLKKERKKTHDT